MIKKRVLFLAICISCKLFSQKINLDKYQYLIVYDKFEFLKKTDQYQTSSLTKFLLKKKGFKVFLSNEVLPEEIVVNRCSSLFVSVKDNSTMLMVKNVIEIKDCFNNVVYTSDIGKSKQKEYKKAYQEAIRKAFNTMEDFQYSYKPDQVISSDINTKVVEAKNKPFLAEISQGNGVANGRLNQDEGSKVTLYAQEKNNGFQLVNLKPEVVFVVLKTNVKDVFIIQDKNGILYKNGEDFVAEYYENGQLVQKEYQVKF